MPVGNAPDPTNLDSPGAAPSLTPEERREVRREHVLDTADIRFGNSTISCIVLDQSSHGLHVRTGTVVPVPERVQVELRTGTKFSATKRWARGLEIGFSLEQP